VPAAAVIQAPLAYIKVIAVKKLVVEFLAGSIGVQPLRLVVLRESARPNWLSSSTRSPLFRHLIECEAGWNEGPPLRRCPVTASLP